MLNATPADVPQEPQKKWVVSKTGHFWQEHVTPTAWAICGKVRTIPKTYRGVAGPYTLRYFTCLHPQEKLKAGSSSEPPASR